MLKEEARASEESAQDRQGSLLVVAGGGGCVCQGMRSKSDLRRKTGACFQKRPVSA